MGSHSNPAWRGWVHCNYHSGNGIYSIHWWNFPQWEVIATQRGENGFTVITTMGMDLFHSLENGLVELSTMGSHSNPVWREWVHCNYHSGNGIYSIHWRMGWWNFPQWEVIATQRRENGFTVITTVGMESIPFTGEWVGGNFHNGKSQQPSVERMGSL